MVCFPKNVYARINQISNSFYRLKVLKERRIYDGKLEQIADPNIYSDSIKFSVLKVDINTKVKYKNITDAFSTLIY